MAREENLIEVFVDPSSILSVAHRVRDGKVIGGLDTAVVKVSEADYDEYLAAQATCIDFMGRLIEKTKAQKEREVRDEPRRG